MLGLAVGAGVLFSRESAPVYRDFKPRQLLNVEPTALQEPISPIPLDIQLDPRKVALGRRLFHEPRLSADNTISCANCHNLANGGMDSLPRSTGSGGSKDKINVPTVFNSGFNFRQFWDGRVATLEDQVEFPMQRSCGMSSSWADIIVRLEQDAGYHRDFAAIYPDRDNRSAIKDALATFERSLITPNSKFDRFLRGDKDAIDKDELAGYELFKSLGCISCHQGVNVGGNMYEKFGLFGDYFAHRGNVQETDYGRYNVTGIEEHRYEFRVPSLRNVALTAPYFHDGSAENLGQAVETMGKYQLGVNLNKDEVARILKFLGTLTGIYQPEPGV